MSQRSGTHFQGPVLASGRTAGGNLEDAPLAAIDRVRSVYKVFVENFDYPIASAATLAGSGCTATDINTPTSPTYAVTGAAPYLLINPGSKADSGVELQWVAAVSQATYITPAQRFLPPVVSTATLMDTRELFWFTRVGFMSDTTAWDGKALLGWFTTDTTLMTNTTGVPSVATGGGLGFHIGETGSLTYLGAQTAITAAGTDTGTSILALDTAATFQWYNLGFRCRWVDASAGTGVADFYVNGANVGSITTDLPMASTQTYGTTFAIQNGPARASDMAVDYVVMGITRAGLTYPYTGGIGL